MMQKKSKNFDLNKINQIFYIFKRIHDFNNPTYRYYKNCGCRWFSYFKILVLTSVNSDEKDSFKEVTICRYLFIARRHIYRTWENK